MARFFAQPTETTDLADSLEFDQNASNDIWSLGFEHNANQAIDGLKNLLKPPDPLPVIVSPRPDPKPITTPEQMQATWQSGQTGQPAEGLSQSPTASDTSGVEPAPPPGSATSSAPAGSPMPAGAPPVAMPTGGGGAFKDNNERLAYVRQSAAAHGHDPETVARVAMSEGAGPAGSVGDQGTSFGALQAHVGGGQGDDFRQQTGLDPADPNNERALIDWQLSNLGQTGWSPFHGAAAAGIGDRQGIGTGTPSSDRQIAAPPSQAPQGGAPASMPSNSGQAVGRPTQFAEGLSYAEAIAACGLAGVAWFMAKAGRTPKTVAEVKQAAEVSKSWDAGAGMHGIEATASLLRDTYHIATHVEDGVDFNKVRADVLNGNPVLFDTNAGSAGHYYTVNGARQRPDGQWEYDLDTSATDLKASKGRRWYTENEVEGLGFGKPFKAIYMDNPQTPAPSVVAGASPAPVAQTQDTGGPPSQPQMSAPSSNGSSPTPPTVAQMSNRSGQPEDPSGLMLRQPLQPTSGPDSVPSFQDSQTEPASPPTDASASGVNDASAPGPGAPPTPASQVIPNEDQTSYGPAPQPSGGLGIVDTSGPEEGPQQPPESPLKPLYDMGHNLIGYVDHGVQAVANSQPVQDLTQAASTAAQESDAREAARLAREAQKSPLQQQVEHATQQAALPNFTAVTDALAQTGVNPQDLTRAVDIARGVLHAIPDATSDTIDAALSTAGLDRSNVGFDTPFGRLGLADAILNAPLPGAAGNVLNAISMLGPMPLAHAPGGPAAGRVAGAIENVGDRAATAVRGAVQSGAEAAVGAVRGGLARVGEGIASNAGHVAALDAERAGQEAAPAYATLGIVPPEQPRRRLVPVEQRPAAVPEPEEVRIPRAGYADDISPGAEDMLRNAPENAPPAQPLSRAEVAQKAQDVLGVNPEQVRAWQDEALSTPEDARPVRGEALRQAQYIDAENANRAIERLRAAREQVQASGGSAGLSEADQSAAADALLEAAQTARAMSRSTAADTAQGRAAARELNQRRSAILSRDAFQTAERARQVGQDAAFAAQESLRASRTGTISPQAEQRLRTVRAKLADAERNGLIGDGAGGRLDQLEQRTAVAQQQTRAQAALNPSVPLGTRIAGEVGSSLGGGVVGAAAGAALPANTPEERRRNALLGAGAGLVGGPIARRIIGRGQGGALGTFGVAPGETPRGIGAATQAFGANPGERVQMRFRVVPLEDLITSHTDRLAVNPAFPPELQPRIRERVASQAQIDKIIAQFDPGQMLVDTHTIDRGPMIVGSDGVVESGNGRSIALRRLAAEHPEKYQQYLEELRTSLTDYGLSAKDLEGIKTPVLVRERTSDLDRVAFTGAANVEASARMAPIEEALQDVQRLPDGLVARLAVNEDQTINAALLSPANQDLVRAFVGGLPASQQGSVLGARGDLNATGLERLKSALLAKTYTGEAGARIATAFVEGTDSGIRNIENAIYASLPSMARAESSIATGARDASMSVAPDVAAAADVYARLKRAGMSVSDYLQQAGMFGDRETTPFQDQLLQFFNDNARSPKRIRAMLEEYAGALDDSGMFGAPANATKEEVLNDALRTLGPAEADAGADVGRVGAGSDELAGAAQGSAASSEPSQSAAPLPAAEESLQRFQTARGAPEQVTGPLTPAADLVPRSGPEGSLAVEGAPQPTPRPGAIPDNAIPSTGGPEGSLDVEGAPVRPANLPAPGDLPATGGPEGRLRAEGAPPEAANLPPVAEGAAPTGGPAGTLQSPPLGSAADQRGIQQARIRGVVDSIDTVLANPTAPGQLERLAQLHADLQDISKTGFQRSSDIRQRLQRNGLLRAGLASKTEDVTNLVDALSRVDPSKPEDMRAVLNIISKPRLIDHLLEYQYVNMLSSPITQAVNITSNALQIAGRLLLQNPLEFSYSGGRSTGVGAAFQGAARGFQEGRAEAGQIMRTGVSSQDTQRALETGDYGHVGREALTEKFGKAGALLHVISTRPLSAMDALLGHVAYASAADQYAQRTADALLKNSAASVKGMSREAARAHVMSNIWDYPDVIKQAGKIEDYTLLRSKDTEGQGWGRVERGLRQLAAVRNPAEDAGFGGQTVSFIANNILPFFNVPLNFAKQGAERTIGVPINAVRSARAFARGDVEQGAELAAKATIGAAAITTAGVLASGDNLTGDGPSDPGQRAVWMADHRPNSFRVPGTSTWISWDGTPFAIPFGMVAGAKEGWTQAQDSAAKKGQAEPLAVAGAATLKGAQGAAAGFTSQSFIRALGDQYKLITGQDTGLSTVANQATSNISRFVPASGMLNFMAQVTDGMFAPGYDRDPGKPQSVADLPQNIAAREAIRIPGLREQVDPRLTIYGQPSPNERSGLAGALPYYRGSGPMAGDPITQNLEAAKVGDVSAPSQLSIDYKGKSYGQIPLSVPEQHRFNEIAGQEYRRELEQAGAATVKWTPDVYDKIRSSARMVAERQIQAEIGGDEINRRLTARPQPAGVP